VPSGARILVTVRCATIATPAGALVLVGDGEVVTRMEFGLPVERTWARDDGGFADARHQLAAWFAGERRELTFPVAPAGTEFQRRVWDALRAIPYGMTRTYGEIAAELGTAPRAVGNANGRNPLSIVIPCHRLVGADGGLRGYLGGTGIKRWLLDHERAVAGIAGAPGD